MTARLGHHVEIIGLLGRLSNTEIAARFGVARRTIADIRNRKSWPTVWGEVA